MTHEEVIKVLNSRRSSKEELRSALAFAMGVAPPPPKEAAKEKSTFSQCKDIFHGSYENYTGVPYVFLAKDGIALSGIIKKIEDLDSSNVAGTFIALLQNLPEWYKRNAFSLPVINSKFNEIIASISKKTGTVNGNSREREAVRAAFSGANKP